MRIGIYCLSLMIMSSTICLLACQKSNSTGNTTTTTTGKGTLTVGGTTYSNVTCTQKPDTVSKNPLAIVPSVFLTAINGNDSVGFFLLNLPTQNSWSGSFSNGDSSAVKIG